MPIKVRVRIHPSNRVCPHPLLQASADKIIREIGLFGPDFERYEEVQAELDQAAEEKDAEPDVPGQTTVVDKSKAKKGKIIAKSTGLTYQFQIMESIGVPRAEIKKFADPLHWLKVFPPIAIVSPLLSLGVHIADTTQADHNSFGSRIDWRRRFLTTEANPYYDAFVRWQVNKLYKLGKIKFGERYTIYSPKDGQPCMDHDRQDGEGFGPQEYTGIKMEVVNWSPVAKAAIEGKVGGRKVYMVAATLRPETMYVLSTVFLFSSYTLSRYGQTNCFVGTTIKYGIFAMNDSEAFLCTLRSVRNMTFQGLTATRGNIDQLVEISGSKLIGTKIKAPYALNPEVYVLPMDNVLATKVHPSFSSLHTLYSPISHIRAQVSSPLSRPTHPMITKPSWTSAKKLNSTK
jgi:leucyl-tRNA synthetase